MSNERGHYGNGNNVPRVGQDPRTIYVAREHGSSIGKWLLGAVAIGGGILLVRHQSRQIEQLYKTTGTPYQSFTGSLRESVRELPTRARAAYRGLTGGRTAKPVKPVVAPTEQLAPPAHSTRSRSGGR